MLKVSRWFASTYRVADETVLNMKLKRLRWDEAQPFLASIADLMDGLDLGASKEEAKVAILQKPGAVAKALKALDPELVKKWFTDFVKEVEGLEVDGEPAKDGATLYEVADQAIVLHVLLQLVTSASLRLDEGKASRSASGSDSPGASGPSPAESAGPESGAAPETARATPRARRSSSAQA